MPAGVLVWAAKPDNGTSAATFLGLGCVITGTTVGSRPALTVQHPTHHRAALLWGPCIFDRCVLGRPRTSRGGDVHRPARNVVRRGSRHGRGTALAGLSAFVRPRPAGRGAQRDGSCCFGDECERATTVGGGGATGPSCGGLHSARLSPLGRGTSRRRRRGRSPVPHSAWCATRSRIGSMPSKPYSPPERCTTRNCWANRSTTIAPP
jgi:hypothetical protein